METLNAKQEAIKKAYGEFWETVKDHVDENGWINCKDIDYFKDCGFMRDQVHYIDNGREWDNFKIIFWRIPSLQGIENNNGWIRIDDFVKYTDEKFWIFNSHTNDLYQGQLFDDDMFPINRYATHYQPIQKPKLPIY